MKWVRYYVDFCHKYKFAEAKEDSLPPFIDKLRQKRQTFEQQNQAYQAVKLYLGQTSISSEKLTSPAEIKAAPKPHDTRMVNDVNSGHGLAKVQVPAGSESGSPSKTIRHNSNPKNGMSSKAHYVEKLITSTVIRERTEKYNSDAKPTSYPTSQLARPEQKAPSVATPDRGPCRRRDGRDVVANSNLREIRRGFGWNDALDRLKTTIKTRHYSPKTLRAYLGWIRRFQGFVYNKSTESLSSLDVKKFIEHLAVEKKSLHRVKIKRLTLCCFFTDISLRKNLVIIGII